ncbi:MAG: hypothetical protein MUO76_09850, partial [Anaerolineaceae bacterium]|nr:hypothetical protein [Anaerolineaceae bacterium]
DPGLADIRTALQASNRELQLTISLQNSWALEFDKSNPVYDPDTGEQMPGLVRIKPEHREDWQSFIRMIVSDASPAQLQIGSEPENEWVNVDGFVEALCLAYEAVKETNPEVILMAPGFNPRSILGMDEEAGANLLNLDDAQKISFMRDFFASGAECYDILSFQTSSSHETIPPTVKWFQDQMSASDYQKPIWIDAMFSGRYLSGSSGNAEEIGLLAQLQADNPEAIEHYRSRQASDMVKKLVTAFASGVEKVFVSTSTDGSASQMPIWLHSGLLDTGGNPKPAYYTYQLLIQKIDGFTAVEQISETIFRFSFSDKNDVLIAWNGSEKLDFDLKPVLQSSSLRVTYIIVEGWRDQPEIIEIKSSIVPLDDTPVFIETNR